MGRKGYSSSESPRAVTTEPPKEGGLTGAGAGTPPHSRASPSRLLHTQADARSTGLLSTFQARFPFRESYLGPFHHLVVCKLQILAVQPSFLGLMHSVILKSPSCFFFFNCNIVSSVFCSFLLYRITLLYSKMNWPSESVDIYIYIYPHFSRFFSHEGQASLVAQW